MFYLALNDIKIGRLISPSIVILVNLHSFIKLMSSATRRHFATVLVFFSKIMKHC